MAVDVTAETKAFLKTMELRYGNLGKAEARGLNMRAVARVDELDARAKKNRELARQRGK